MYEYKVRILDEEFTVKADTIYKAKKAAAELFQLIPRLKVYNLNKSALIASARVKRWKE